MKLDTILLEILGNKVAAIAEEIGLTLQRTGRTLYVKETADFGTGLVTRDGRFFAYPRAIGVSHFIDLDCGPTIHAVPDLEPGDVIATNHAYLSSGLATHTPDIHLIRPYFHGGRIVCYGWCYVHATDIGGKVPSSISPSSHEIFQEGFLIPPMKLARRGVVDETFLKLFRVNCRIPEENVGDLNAMLASLAIGEKRIGAIVEQHGERVFLDAQDDLISYAAAKSRAVLRQIPDGCYEFWDYLDDDAVSPVPVRIRLAMKVNDGEVELDFTGTDPQVAAAYNIATMGRRHALLTVRLLSFICTYDKTAPLNVGLCEPIRVRSPAASLINAQFPAAVGVRHAAARRVADVVLGALATAVPDKVLAASAGANAPTAFANVDPATGRQTVVVVQNVVGGMGARKGRDGVDGRDSGLSNLANNPLEIVEAEGGVRVHEFTLRRDSGGPGQWRGGVGLELSFRVGRDGGTVLSRGMERLRFQPWGSCGGLPGARFRAVLNRGSADERELGKIDELAVTADDVVTIMTPGGGGYGDPLRRDSALVGEDVRRGLVSVEAALRDYAVQVSAEGEVDLDATRELRAGTSADRSGFGFGANRVAWERVFDDEVMRCLNERLYASPIASRTRLRRAFFRLVVPELWTPGHPPLQVLLADADGRRQAIAAAFDVVFGSDRTDLGAASAR